MIKKKLGKMMPGSKITYTAPKPRLQSVATPEMLRKMKKGPVKQKAGYKIPRTPKTSGLGWGGM